MNGVNDVDLHKVVNDGGGCEGGDKGVLKWCT